MSSLHSLLHKAKNSAVLQVYTVWVTSSVRCALPQVTVKLIGSEAESNIHTLTDPEKPVFERGSVDYFVLTTPFPLGEVQTIRLQHDNSGGHPSW